MYADVRIVDESSHAFRYNLTVNAPRVEVFYDKKKKYGPGTRVQCVWVHACLLARSCRTSSQTPIVLCIDWYIYWLARVHVRLLIRHYWFDGRATLLIWLCTLHLNQTKLGTARSTRCRSSWRSPRWRGWSPRLHRCSLSHCSRSSTSWMPTAKVHTKHYLAGYYLIR